MARILAIVFALTTAYWMLDCLGWKIYTLVFVRYMVEKGYQTPSLAEVDELRKRVVEDLVKDFFGRK